jgi:predicted transcriptional regulator
MLDQSNMDPTFRLPDDLVEEVNKLALELGETPRDVVIAAVDHFTRIPEERRKAVMRGTSIRRRG